MRGRVAMGAALVLLLTTPFITGTVAATAAATARAIAGCVIVTNPTLTDHTSCPAANLVGVDLKSSNLSYADLESADLAQADLSGATLTGADLAASSLQGADLRGANLTMAVMTNALLVGADLEGVDLSNRNLSNADLSEANLAGVNLTGDILLGVNWTDTVCPDGSPSTRVGNTCVNDLMVLEGAAIGSTAGTSSALATIGQAPNSSGTTPSTFGELGGLPLTGAPVLPLTVAGVALIVSGLFLVRVADPAKRRRLRKARQ